MCAEFHLIFYDMEPVVVFYKCLPDDVYVAE